MRKWLLETGKFTVFYFASQAAPRPRMRLADRTVVVYVGQHVYGLAGNGNHERLHVQPLDSAVPVHVAGNPLVDRGIGDRHRRVSAEAPVVVHRFHIAAGQVSPLDDHGGGTRCQRSATLTRASEPKAGWARGWLHVLGQAPASLPAVAGSLVKISEFLLRPLAGAIEYSLPDVKLGKLPALADTAGAKTPLAV